MREGGRRLIRRQVEARRGRGAKGDGEPRAGGSASNEERQELTEKKKKKKGKKEKGRTLQFIDRPTVGPSGDARGKIKNAARLAGRGGVLLLLPVAQVEVEDKPKGVAKNLRAKSAHVTRRPSSSPRSRGERESTVGGRQLTRRGREARWWL